MSLITQQIQNEFKTIHHMISHVREDLSKSDMLHYVDDLVNLIRKHVENSTYTYVTKSGETRIWQSKLDRHTNLLKIDLEELSLNVVAYATVQPISTLTAIVGMIKKYFKNDNERMDLESAAEVIGLFAKLDLIDIKLPRDTEEGVVMVHSNIEYEGNLGDYLRTTRHVAPSLLPPKKVTSNRDSGYLTFNSSLILGGKFHEFHVPYDHINRMNSVALSIEPRVIKQTEPVFKEKLDETEAERSERYLSWKQLNVESVVAWADLISLGNKFYLTHKYDERLRTYSHGYQTHTQGDSYRKSVLELANKEVIEID